MSVTEYETQFTKLSQFALELVATEQKRKWQFIQGLNLDIKETLAALQINTFIETLDLAQRVENAKS